MLPSRPRRLHGRTGGHSDCRHGVKNRRPHWFLRESLAVPLGTRESRNIPIDLQ
jgi:hypothetical protein